MGMILNNLWKLLCNYTPVTAKLCGPPELILKSDGRWQDLKLLISALAPSATSVPSVYRPCGASYAETTTCVSRTNHTSSHHSLVTLCSRSCGISMSPKESVRREEGRESERGARSGAGEGLRETATSKQQAARRTCNLPAICFVYWNLAAR